MKEKNLDFLGYPNYIINENGDIWSIKRTYMSGRWNKIIKDIGNKYLIQRTSQKYLRISLSMNKIKKIFSIHRLVALAFIPNPENKPFINHIDGNKLNNHVSNLEWCTHAENIRHAIITGLIKKGAQCHNSKAIKCVETNTLFGSITEASEITKINRKLIAGCLNKSSFMTIKKGKKYEYKYTTAGGYHWEYINE